MTLKDARSYINYGIKEGFFDDEMFAEMNDEQLIKFAEYTSARGDAIANDIESEIL